MMKHYKMFKTSCLTLLALLATFTNVKATTFTAIASGNLSSSTTWAGGNIPTVLSNGDNIVIGSLFNVNMDQSIELSSGTNLDVDGTLMGTAGNYLKMDNGASITGAGMIDIDSFSGNFTSGFTFAGNMTTNAYYSQNGYININNAINVDNTLYLAAGTLDIFKGTLQMSQGSTIIIENGSMMMSGTGVFDLSSGYNVHYKIKANTSAGIELSGSGLKDITIDIGSGNKLSLSGKLTVTNMLTITSGSLDLNGHDLEFGSNSDVSIVSGAGITSSSNSDITLNAGSSGFSGQLRFTSGGNVADNFTVSMNSATAMVTIDGGLKVNSKLDLQQGIINIGSGKLELLSGASISGGSASSYVATEAGGRLSIDVLTGNSKTFHVGSSSNYAPAVVTSASTSGSSKFSVGFDPTVKANGSAGNDISTSEPMVKGTWFVESSASSNVEVELQLMWDAAMEVNSFDRTKAYIAHYMSAGWTGDARVNATMGSNGMYSIKRSGIKSFSPFAVFDDNTPSSVNELNSDNKIAIAPNPASNTITITTSKKLQADIYNISGQLVHSTQVTNGTAIDISKLTNGMYYIRLNDGEEATTHKFVKQ